MATSKKKPAAIIMVLTGKSKPMMPGKMSKMQHEKGESMMHERKERKGKK